jgi:hypothetical protein
MDSPGTFTASTCSRPLGEDLKMRTLPREMKCSPVQGSPSENTNSPALNRLRKVCAASSCSSAGERLDSSAVFSRTAARLTRSALTREFYQDASQVIARPGL